VQGEAVTPGTQAVATAHAATGTGRRSPGGRGLGLELREQLRRRIGKGRVVGLLAVEPTRHPTHHAIEDRQQVAAGGRREQHERQAGAGLGDAYLRSMVSEYRTLGRRCNLSPSGTQHASLRFALAST